ncbi:hypothetical protein BDR26DRAFT_901351 [Obelidium mucronatum]|nr:hypothetical protein BDR26DRAFT_901351 [Obelidium mucronatum]
MPNNPTPTVDKPQTCTMEASTAPDTGADVASSMTVGSTFGPGIRGVWTESKRKRGAEEDESDDDEALGSPTDGGHDEPAVRGPPEKKAKLVELTNNKELPPVEQLVAGLQVRNRMELDRQEIIQNPNRAASIIDERQGMAAAFKTILLNALLDAQQFGEALSQVAAAQGQACFYVCQAFNRFSSLFCPIIWFYWNSNFHFPIFWYYWKYKRMFLMSSTSAEKWNEYLVGQYHEAFPPLPLLEMSKQLSDSRKMGSAKKQGSQKVQSGTAPKQIIKNFDFLFNKLDKILELRIFGGLQAVVEELDKEESVAMKYSIILNKLVRQFTGICSTLYQERCDGKLGRSEKMGSFGVSLLLEVIKWLKLFTKSAKKKKGTSEQIKTFLLDLHPQGTSVGPLLTTQEQAKVNWELQQAAGSKSGTNSKNESSEDSESSETDGEGGDRKRKPRRSRRKDVKEEEQRVIKTNDDDYVVYLPDAVMKLLNLSSREVNGVIDLTKFLPILRPLHWQFKAVPVNHHLVKVIFRTCYLPMPIGKSLLHNASSVSRLNKRRPFDNIVPVSFHPPTHAPPLTISLVSPPMVTPSATSSDGPPTPIVAPGTPLAPSRVLRICKTENQYSAHRKAVSKRKIRAQRSPAAHERELESQRIQMQQLRAAATESKREATRLQNSKQHRVAYDQKLLEERLKRVYGPDELSTIDSLLGFGLQSSQEAIYIKCAERLSFNCMTKHCCVVCDCDYVKSEMKYHSIGSEYRNLRRVLQVDAARVAMLDPLLVAQYDVQGFDVRLSRLFLSPSGFYFYANKLHNLVILKEGALMYQPLPGHFVSVPQDNLLLALCPDCFTATRPGKMDGDAGEELEIEEEEEENKELRKNRMPVEAISNENWIGYAAQDCMFDLLKFFELHHQGYKENKEYILSDAAVPEENTRKLQHIGLFFPTLLPFGEGGPACHRVRHLSVNRWIKRCLKLHGGIFGRHWGFTAIAYDYTALEQSFSQQYLTMRVRASAISDGKWTKEDIQKCYNHSRQMDECLKRGVTLPEAPPEVKQLMDIKKAILPELRAFVGSDKSRQAGLHTAFGLQRRLGVANIFATISPATSRSWAVAINCDLVNGEHCQLKFLVGDGKLALPGTDGIILPNNNARTSAASSNSYECADYARRVLNVFLEDFIGWDFKFRAPVRGGGCLGIPRFVTTSAETQKQGDIHFHMVISLHGFPRTSAEF